MINVNAAVEVDDQVLEDMIFEPTAKFQLKLVQRDRTYDGTPEPAVADFVWKVEKA